MEKEIDQLIEYASDAWLELDHNVHELLASRLMLAIQAIKVAQQGEHADKFQTCGASRN